MTKARNNNKNRHRYKTPEAIPDELQLLMMKQIDGEISPGEAARLESLLETNPNYRKEFEDMNKVKEESMNLKEHLVPQMMWEDYWGQLYNRLERGLSWVLISIGCIVLLSYGGYHMVLELFKAQDIPVFLHGAIIALISGVVILLVSVIREKFILGKHDKYKGVQR